MDSSRWNSSRQAATSSNSRGWPATPKSSLSKNLRSSHRRRNRSGQPSTAGEKGGEICGSERSCRLFRGVSAEPVLLPMPTGRFAAVRRYLRLVGGTAVSELLRNRVMSIRNLPQLMLIAGICAAQATVASAETPAVAVAKPAVGAAHPRVAQAAQVPARPAALQVGSEAPGALPGASPMTLWKFMGVPQGIQKLRGATTNRRGNFPGREPKPPLKALADPANLLSGNPDIETAAKIKQQEDMKKQKIKALKYLATIGCGC